DRLGAAAGERPALTVRDRAEQRRGRGHRRGGEVADRVRGHPGEEGPSALRAEGQVPGGRALHGGERSEERRGERGAWGEQRRRHRALVPEGELDHEVLVAGEGAEGRPPG